VRYETRAERSEKERDFEVGIVVTKLKSDNDEVPARPIRRKNPEIDPCSITWVFLLIYMKMRHYIPALRKAGVSSVFCLFLTALV